MVLILTPHRMNIFVETVNNGMKSVQIYKRGNEAEKAGVELILPTVQTP